MQQNTWWTPVIFRMFQGEVIALFVHEPGTDGPYTCQSYVHAGQHGSADPQVIIDNGRPAKSAEYKALFEELSNIGFRLKVRFQQSYHDIEVRKSKLEKFHA